MMRCSLPAVMHHTAGGGHAARFALSGVLGRGGDIAGELAELKKILAVDPSNVMCACSLGRWHHYQGRHEEALGELLRVLTCSDQETVQPPPPPPPPSKQHHSSLDRRVCVVARAQLLYSRICVLVGLKLPARACACYPQHAPRSDVRVVQLRTPRLDRYRLGGN